MADSTPLSILIEPIQSVVFKWVRHKIISQSSNIIEPIQSVVFKWRIRDIKLYRRDIEPIQSVVFKSAHRLILYQFDTIEPIQSVVFKSLKLKAETSLAEDIEPIQSVVFKLSCYSVLAESLAILNLYRVLYLN